MLFGSKNQPCKLIVHRFWSLQQTSQYAKYQTYKNIQDVYCVAVLQCCSSKNGCMKVWNELYIYIYRYRTIFCVWERLLENCNTATKCCRFQISVDSFYSLSFSGEKKSKKVVKKFVNRNDNVVPLHSKDWTRTGLQPTFDIFRVWGGCARCYSEN